VLCLVLSRGPLGFARSFDRVWVWCLDITISPPRCESALGLWGSDAFIGLRNTHEGVKGGTEQQGNFRGYQLLAATVGELMFISFSSSADSLKQMISTLLPGLVPCSVVCADIGPQTNEKSPDQVNARSPSLPSTAVTRGFLPYQISLTFHWEIVSRRAAMLPCIFSVHFHADLSLPFSSNTFPNSLV
jgi:hypothetical protein